MLVPDNVSVPPPALVSRPLAPPITPENVVLGCCARWAGMRMVLWMAVKPYLAEPDVLAIRICKVRAGHLPLPLKQVLSAFAAQLRRSELRVQWRQADGDPVALITLPTAPSAKGYVVRLAAQAGITASRRLAVPSPLRTPCSPIASPSTTPASRAATRPWFRHWDLEFDSSFDFRPSSLPPKTPRSRSGLVPFFLLPSDFSLLTCYFLPPLLPSPRPSSILRYLTK